MIQRLMSEASAFLLKYYVLLMLVLGGTLTQVFMLNRTRKLSLKENCAVILSGCVTGGTYAIIASSWNNKIYLALSGFVSMAGYNICNFIIAYTRDPAKMKEMVVGTLKKIVDSL